MPTTPPPVRLAKVLDAVKLRLSVFWVKYSFPTVSSNPIPVPFRLPNSVVCRRRWAVPYSNFRLISARLVVLNLGLPCRAWC